MSEHELEATTMAEQGEDASLTADPGVTLLMMLANAVSPEQEQALDDWYTHVHIPELLALGVLASTRYKVVEDSPAARPPRHRYLAVHEIATDHLDEVMGAIRDAQVDGRMGRSPALDIETSSAYFLVPATARITPEEAAAMLADPRYAEIKATEQPFAAPRPATGRPG